MRWPERAALAVACLLLLWAYLVLTSGGGEIHLAGLRLASHNWRRPALLGAVCVIAALALRGRQRITADIAATDPWLRGLILGMAAGTLVFLWVYLPSMLEHRTFPEADLLNALVVRNPSQWRSAADVFRDLHVYTSLRSFGLAVMLAIAAMLPWHAVDRRTRRAAIVLIAVSLLVLIIPVRVGGASIWMTVFRRLPGFDVIRDPTRIIYLYELAAVLGMAWLLTRLPRHLALRVAMLAVLAASIALDHNRDVFEGYRPRATFRRWVEAPIAVDPSCRSFFIKGATDEYMSRSPHMWTLYGIDAMFVSLEYSLPTLNGYSAFFPQEWNLWNPHEPDYPSRVRQWIDRHHLTGVCQFDIVARTMTPF